MFEGLRDDQLKGAVEALLFVTDEPVGTIALADALDVPPARAEAALVELSAQLADERRGIQLREVAGGWRLFTHPDYHELLERYVLSWDTRRLSQAAMETLAVVAYLQPVTRSGVASVRGVNSDSSINSLVEKGLLREAGVADAPGNPVLYATTRAFLERFGLRSTADLPDLDQFAPDEATRAFVRERLGAVRSDARLAGDARIAGDEWFAEGAGSPLSAGGVGSEGAEGLVAEEAASGDMAGIGGVSGAFGSGDSDEPPIVAEAGASAEAQRMLMEAMASGFGLVEKIDFDGLSFETDDE